MPTNSLPTWEETQDQTQTSPTTNPDLPSWEQTSPFIQVQLSPYQQAQMQGQTTGLGATTGPAHPEEVAQWAQAVQLPQTALSMIGKGLEEGGAAALSSLKQAMAPQAALAAGTPELDVTPFEPGKPTINIPSAIFANPLQLFPNQTVRDIGGAIAQREAQLASGFTTPGAVTTLPAVESPLIRAYMAGSAAVQLPESIREVAQSKTGPELASALTGLGAQGLMAYGLGRSLVKPKVSGATYTDPETGETTIAGNHVEAAAEQGVDATGPRESRETPEFGFEVTQPSGKTEVVSRDTAEQVAKESGQLLKPPETGQLHSDEVASPVEPNRPLGDTEVTISPLQAMELLPPVKTGYVRLFRGGTKGKEGLWFSTSDEVASFHYQNHGIDNPATLSYIDVPEKDAQLYSDAAESHPDVLSGKTIVEGGDHVLPKEVAKKATTILESPSPSVLPPLPAEIQRALDKQRAAVAKGETGPYPDAEADAKQWQENQAKFAEGAKKGQPDLELWNYNEKVLKNKYKAEQAGPQPGVTPQQQGGGAAELGEIQPTAPFSPEEVPTHGIAARTTEEAAKRGLIAPVEPGEGISAKDSVEHGTQLLNDGADPQAVLNQFNQTQAVSADGMAIVRAHAFKLRKAALKAYDEFGPNSPEYEAAWEADSDWHKAIKPMQTAWHKIGQAQQGEVEIDTGTFHGLRLAHQEATGKDFTPKQSEEAKGKAQAVKEAQDTADTTEKTVITDLKKGVPDAELPPTPEEQAANENAAQVLRSLEGKKRSKAEQKAYDAAMKTVRDWAVKQAKLENQKRVADVVRDIETASIQERLAKKAEQAAIDVKRRAAARAAELENKARTQAQKQAAEAAKVQAKEAQRAADAASKTVRDWAVKQAQLARKLQDNPDLAVWEASRKYLEQGQDSFNEIVNKVSTDLGMTFDKVAYWLGRTKRQQAMIDELWRQQQLTRKFKAAARNWLYQQEAGKLSRALSAVPRTLFKLKVGLHGTVALGTHAPAVAFLPQFWGDYFTNFGRMYKMIGSRAYHEMRMQELARRPNYIRAQRAGLQNDPFKYEDYNSPKTTVQWGALTGMGDRGYSVLKILRQDMFDQQWSQLPKYMQNDAMAAAVSDAINHLTGVTQKSVPYLHLGLFAPRLLGSRMMWLFGDPAKAAKTFVEWKDASEADKHFAISQIKEKATVAATLGGLLAANQGFLSATGSDQKINLTDPFKSDWLKFKVSGHNVAYGNPMITMVRLPIRLYQLRSGPGGKLRNLVYPDEDTYTVLGEYGRSQLSPFASLALTLWLQSDYAKRPLPSSERPVPARLRKQGIEPYSWTEFWTQQMLPIPAEEAMKEVWRNGWGLDPEQIKALRNAIATASLMGATGARISEDVQY